MSFWGQSSWPTPLLYLCNKVTRDEVTRNKISKPLTIPCKVTKHHGSVLVCHIPFLRATGIDSAPVPKKMLLMATTDNCCPSARGDALPCWATFPRPLLMPSPRPIAVSPLTCGKRSSSPNTSYQEFTAHLMKTYTRVSVQRAQASAVAIT